MCLRIDFDLQAQGSSQAAPFLDSFELEQLFASTRRSIGGDLQRKFAEVVCGEHGQAPAFTISGVYDNQAEELDIKYHVESCCRPFLLRVMQVLNRRP